MNIPLDRMGNCPHCKCSWEGEDIVEELHKLSVFITNRRDKIEHIATKAYGWTDQNMKKFSKVVDIEKDGKKFLMCPDCRTVYDEQGTIIQTEEKFIVI